MLGKSSPKVNVILLPVLTVMTSGAVSFGIAMKFLHVALNAAVEDARKINGFTQSDN
ncbi:hypothetical protein DPMN_053421 [Dreissena polymorpha]|uniref:Uncharacterized protein n=1 Tax=Dreissena polymorpha TaxID=45954 RepID=A0A9D4HS63_DREPO|nr:hypothetical protein DPMN_053421 [Dreissena polymorpha]